jgi:Rod binding domain-containing protein
MPQINEFAPLNSGQTLLQARSQQAIQLANCAQGTQDKSNVESAAKQFESILLQKWLEDAEHSFAKVPGDDSDDGTKDPGADQFKSLAMQQLAERMTASGGVGIAKMIVHQLAPKTESAASTQIIDSMKVTNGVLPPRNEIKVPARKDR